MPLKMHMSVNVNKVMLNDVKWFYIVFSAVQLILSIKLMGLSNYLAKTNKKNV